MYLRQDNEIRHTDSCDIADTLQQSDFETTSVCFDHKRQTTGNWVVWTPHYVFIQSRPWCRKDIFQSSDTRLEFSRDISLQDSKVNWVDAWTWERPHIFVSEHRFDWRHCQLCAASPSTFFYHSHVASAQKLLKITVWIAICMQQALNHF